MYPAIYLPVPSCVPSYPPTSPLYPSRIRPGTAHEIPCALQKCVYGGIDAGRCWHARNFWQQSRGLVPVTCLRDGAKDNRKKPPDNKRCNIPDLTVQKITDREEAQSPPESRHPPAHPRDAQGGISDMQSMARTRACTWAASLLCAGGALRSFQITETPKPRS